MIVIASVSQLRNNIADYLDKVMKGARVLVRDEKRNITIAEIVQSRSFDKTAYQQALDSAAGVFSGKNHPEWKTQKDISSWLAKNRLADQRSF